MSVGARPGKRGEHAAVVVFLDSDAAEGLADLLEYEGMTDRGWRELAGDVRSALPNDHEGADQ